ncbi:hypothetical protein D3C84_986230 [compost metagenome]
MVLGVLVGAVDMVGEEGAAVTALLPIRSEHEVVDDQGAAPVEQVGQGFPAVRPFEGVDLVDTDPGQRPPLGAEPVPFTGKGLFLAQQLLAGMQPFFAGNHGVLVDFHVALS